MSSKLQIRLFLSWLASVYLMAASTSVQAAELALSRSPVFLGTQIDPNVFFMLDDSASMDFEILTPRHQYFKNYWKDNETIPIAGGLFVSDTKENSSAICKGVERINDVNYGVFRYIYGGRSGANTDNLNTSNSVCELENYPAAALRDWRVRSSALNVMYYNPAATYLPWKGFPDARFMAAKSNPVVSSVGHRLFRDLTGFVYHVWKDNLGYDEDDGRPGGIARGPDSVTPVANGMVDLWDSHTTYTVNAASIDIEHLTTTFASVDGAPKPVCQFRDAKDMPQYKKCFGTVSTTGGTLSGTQKDPVGSLTVTQAQQNIANWYQYHRRRSFVMKSAVAEVMSAHSSFRFGLSLLNGSNLLFHEVPAKTAIDDDFPAHNEAILTALFAHKQREGGTPLRRGLERVGRYYSNEFSDKPNPIISACQQNYAVLFTDGYWTGESLSTPVGDSDGDGVAAAAAAGVTRIAAGHKDTLADVAHYFYNKDLSLFFANDVPTSSADQNEEQHMVTFTVAFGVTGNLIDTDGDGLPNPELAENGKWSSNQDGVNDDQEKIDDAWHAAFNSKGAFVSAQTPGGVADALAEILSEITDRAISATSVATNTGSLNAGSHLFQARFDSSHWEGQLRAFKINLDGSIEGTERWEAGSQVDGQNYDTEREIITYNPVEGKGVPFRFPADYRSPNSSQEMTSTQVTALLTTPPYAIGTVDVSEISMNQSYGAALVNYLRGDKVNENEGAGQNFRMRGSVLGDVVNSDPEFVAEPTARYPNGLEAKPYNAFISANAARDGVVYVGANDGMLHGFAEDTGKEVIAYVPNAAYKYLYKLASKDYEHRYFVDGGLNITDVYMGAMDDWRTALVGGLGGGGQGIYALDVTDPASFDEANAASLALWEFDDSDDADLGYTYGRPQIAKMADDRWVAVFGNGYNNTEADGHASTSGHAVLYIVDIETGDLIKKIDTLAGDVATPNGLATPLMIDSDADFVVDYIYAGDLLGNMWKFDVTSEYPTLWNNAFVTAGTPAPLFTTAANQPITSQPQVTAHPDNLGGFMVFFGTGQYLEINDNDPTGQATQAFYGIWDKNTASLTTVSSSDLLAQTINNQYAQGFDINNDRVADETVTLREVSNYPINWDRHLGWKFKLQPEKVEGAANTSNFGERQVSNAVVRGGRVIFTTVVPSSGECEFGGTSFLMELDFRTGGTLGFPAFDLNNDGEYDGDDADASGRAFGAGIIPGASILADGAQDIVFGSGTSGNIDVIRLSVGNESYGRQSWRQLE